MPVEVELPDGSIAEFPDDMAQDKISEAVQTHLKTQAAAAPGAHIAPRQPTWSEALGEINPAVTRGVTGAVGGLLEGVGALTTPSVKLSDSRSAYDPNAYRTADDEFEGHGQPVPVTPNQMADVAGNPAYQAGKYVADLAKATDAPTSRTGKIAESAGAMIPLALSGPVAPATIGAQALGETLDNEYQQAKIRGLSDEQASDAAIKTGFENGLTQAAIWAVLPGPIKKLLGKATGLAGEGAVKQFVARRVAGAAEGATLGAASQAGGNIATGKPVGQNVVPAAVGVAGLGAVTMGPERASVPDVIKQAKAAGLPQAAAEAAKNLAEKGGETDASKNEETTEVHGDVREQPGEGQGEVSKQGGGKGVHPSGEEPETPADVVLKPPEITDEHLTQTDATGKPIGAIGNKPAVAASYFHTWGDKATKPDMWVKFFQDLNAKRDKLYPQETAYQIGLYLRQLGQEKAQPVIDALMQARDNIIADAKSAKAEHGPNVEAMFKDPRYQLGLVAQFPREAVEAAHDEGSAIGKVSNEIEEPLKRAQAKEVSPNAKEEEKEGDEVLTPAVKTEEGTFSGQKRHNEIVLDQAKNGVDATGGELHSEDLLDSGYFKEKAEGAAISAKQQQALPITQPLEKLAAPVVTMEGGESVPMGAAGAGEVPATGQQPGGTHGVSHETLEQRRLRGEIAPVERGQGIGAEASVERGRQLLQNGSDPESIVSNFEKTGRFSADDLDVARAHGERLAQASKKADAEFGPNSPESESAWEADSAWSQRVKKMSTEWHKAGMAQQGETEIDTGTFHGLRKAHQEVTGEDFTPKQRKQAQVVATAVTKAQETADAAQRELGSAIRRETGITNAEQRALDAANRTVRENAVRLAELEKKTAIARTVEEMKAAKIAEEQARKSLKLAQEAARDAAVKLAKADQESETSRAKEQQRKAEEKAAQDALDAASKTVREAAVRLSEAERKKQVATAATDKKIAEQERKQAKRVLDAANKVLRDAAVRAAKADQDNMANPARQVWQKVSDYLDKGVEDFNDIRSKVATDLGISVDKVTKLLGENPRVKRLADDVWRKQSQLRRVKEQAWRWLTNTSIPGYQRALAAIPRALFALKVGFHGTVALGTHAPSVAFQPRFWKSYVTDFGKMYRMVGSPAYYEMQMQNLVRRQNFTRAARAGLVNDPFNYEEYMSPTVAAWSNKLFDKFPASKKGLELYNTVMASGNRGYGVLKILRQDMFDQMWNQLPKTSQIDEVAKAIADGINHATGVVKGKAPKGANVALFAPRLNASRVAWLTVDPIKSAATFADWRNASEGDKHFAINQIKEKAWVVGTLATMLAINQGILSATGSKQKINVTDPMKGDFLKFKAAGMALSYGNPLITMARLPARLYAIRSSDGGKKRNLVYPDEDTYSVLGEYARSQASPFASLAADLWLKSDWMRRQLPNSERPMPKRLVAQGVKRYTWPEFLSEQALPIPAEEAAREVWKTGLGMTPEQVSEARKALATISVMAATGARLNDDWDTHMDVTKDVANWKKQKGYENPPPVVPARANDDLLAGLKSNNETDARKALDQIVAGKSPGEVRKIAEHYRRTLGENQYLTGSRAHEQEYVKQLDSAGKAQYDEAKAERKAMWQKFVKAWRTKYPAATQ